MTILAGLNQLHVQIPYWQIRDTRMLKQSSDELKSVPYKRLYELKPVLGVVDSVAHFITVNKQSESSPDCKFYSSIAHCASGRSYHQIFYTSPKHYFSFIDTPGYIMTMENSRHPKSNQRHRDMISLIKQWTSSILHFGPSQSLIFGGFTIFTNIIEKF